MTTVARADLLISCFLGEQTVTVFRKRRGIENFVIDVQITESLEEQLIAHALAQLTLRSDGVQRNEQHCNLGCVADTCPGVGKTDDMDQVLLDIAFRLPSAAEAEAIRISNELAASMAAARAPSAFCLGGPPPAGSPIIDGARCEPHMTLYKLVVARGDVSDVIDAVKAVADAHTQIAIASSRWGHNPFGAPERYYHQSNEVDAVQREVVSASMDLRARSWPEFDASGERIDDIPPEDPRWKGFNAYGFDEVGKGVHETFTWPARRGEYRVCLDGLPPSKLELGALGVFVIGTYGTCIRNEGQFNLRPRS